MAVPNIFGTATAAIPLSQLDTNFATAITLGNTAVYLGNTTTSLGNVTLTNVTISSGNVTVTGANISGTANVSTLVVTGNATIAGTATTIQGLTVGRGAGAVATNTAVGASALAANQAGGTNNTAIGNAALDANTTGDANTAVGDDALGANTTASNNTAVGYQAGYTGTTGTNNTAIGYQALYSSVTTSNNTAIGYQAGYSAIGISTTVSDNTFIGALAGYSVTSGRKNTFIGNTIGGLGGSGSAVTTGNNNVILGGYTGSAAPISATGSNYIVLSDGDGNVRQTIDSSGNVGIGVTPSAWSNRVAFQNDSACFASSSANRSVAEISANSYLSTAGIFRYLYSSANATLYQQATGAHKWYTAASGTAGDAITFTQAMTLDASGRLGIGVTSPTRTLDIAAATGTAIAFLSSTTGTNAVYYAAGNTGGNFHIGRENSAGTTFGSSAYASVLWSEGAYPLVFATNNNERMRIDSSGNVGIGTSSPSNAKLDIASGNINLSDTYILAWGGSSGRPNIEGSKASSSLKFSTGGGTTHMMIDSSGNVGIGVTPSAWVSGVGKVLEVGFVGNGVWGAAASDVRLVNNTFLVTGAYKYASTGFALMYQMSAGEYQWYNAPSGTSGNTITFTQAMTLNASGNLGIGTTSPSFASGGGLAIYNSSVPRLKFANSTTGDASTDGTQLLVSGSDFYIQQREAASVIIATNGSDRVTVDSSGNVGIGTSSPAGKLHVAGGANSNNLITSSTGTTYLIMGNVDASANAKYSYMAAASQFLLFGKVNDDLATRTEYMRIDSSGNVGIGTSSPATYGKLAVYTATAAQNIIQANTDSGSYTGIVCSLTTSTTSTNQYQFLNCTRTGVQEKLVIRDTGNVQNVNNSYGALSDIKLKENIELAGSQWNDVKALSLVIKKFNLKADEDKIKQIGWIAQDVQLISPGLVNAQTDRDLTTGELLDTTSLSVSYSVAQMKAFKALGEALIKIEELTARLTALESK